MAGNQEIARTEEGCNVNLRTNIWCWLDSLDPQVLSKVRHGCFLCLQLGGHLDRALNVGDVALSQSAAATSPLSYFKNHINTFLAKLLSFFVVIAS